jgi:hypothetical protein
VYRRRPHRGQRKAAEQPASQDDGLLATDAIADPAEDDGPDHQPEHADAENRAEAADLHMPFARDSRNHERNTGEVEPVEQHADEHPAEQAPCEAPDPLRLDQCRYVDNLSLHARISPVFHRKLSCHCEERSDAAISTGAGTDCTSTLTEIASLRSQ